jgi:hypothetical protein
MEASFNPEDTIKPVLSYIGAHLYDGEHVVLPSGATLSVL